MLPYTVFDSPFKRNNTFQQPEEKEVPHLPSANFFQRAKQYILQIVSKSCLSHPNNCSEGHRILLENNFIDQLPLEMLANVASFLKVNDFNSLARSNLTTHWRLGKRYRRKPHVTLKFKYEYDDNGELARMAAEVRLEREMGVRPFRFALKRHSLPIGLSKEEKRAKVIKYYQDERENPREHFTFYCEDVNEALSIHLQFLLSNNIIIDRIQLEEVNEAEVDNISIILKENRVEVCELKLIVEAMNDSHLDLIRVCNPRSLQVGTTFLSPGFFDNALICQIKELEVGGELMKMQDGDLPKLDTRVLVVLRVEGVPAKDIRIFLKQWLDSKKTFDALSLYMATEEPETTWARLFEGMDLQPLHYEEHEYYLRRGSDGAELGIEWSANHIFLYDSPHF